MRRGEETMRPSVELHVDELVLEGFAPGDRRRIGEAVERELARLLAIGDLPARLAEGGEIARLDGGSFEAAAGGRAEAVGGQVARAVFGSLDR
jgi:hypothetical protein